MLGTCKWPKIPSWEGSPPQVPLFTKLRIVVRFYKQFCIAKVAKLGWKMPNLGNFLNLGKLCFTLTHKTKLVK